VYQALFFAKRLHATDLSSLNSWPYGEKCTSLRVSFLGKLGTGLRFREKKVGGADYSRAALRLIARKSLDMPVKGSKFGKAHEITRIRGYHCDT
jgi:hypothetical protein